MRNLKVFLGQVQANQPPTVAANSASVSTNEGTNAANSGTYSDADAAQTVAITPSVGSIVAKSGTNTWTWMWSNAAPDGLVPPRLTT